MFIIVSESKAYIEVLNQRLGATNGRNMVVRDVWPKRICIGRHFSIAKTSQKATYALDGNRMSKWEEADGAKESECFSKTEQWQPLTRLRI
ncbi:hypothetical protein Tco_1275417 [Tanacetum coccineum]